MLTDQRRANELQAALVQVLFETEQRVKQLGAIADKDPFAAGITARLSLNGLGDIHPALFDRYETKKAWAAAHEQLTAFWSSVDQHPQLSVYAQNLFRAIEKLDEWQAWEASVGGDPEGNVARLRAAEEHQERLIRYCKKGTWMTFVVGLVAAVVLHFIDDTAAGFARVFTLLGPILCACAWYEIGRHANLVRAEREAFEEVYGRYNAFVADPLGGQLLEEVAEQHPLLSKGR